MREVYRDAAHQLWEGDISEGDAARLLSTLPPVAAVYTDPPWQRGIAQRFRHWAGKPADVDFKALMGVTADVVASALVGGAPGFVQMGAQGMDVTLDALAAAGLKAQPHPCGQSDEQFRPIGTAFLIAVGVNEPPLVSWGPTDAWAVLCRKALTPHVSPAGVVFDPYVGYGIVLRIADVYGWSCAGMDLNVGRVQEGVKRMLKDRAGDTMKRLRAV